jgi:hypothetical protein
VTPALPATLPTEATSVGATRPSRARKLAATLTLTLALPALAAIGWAASAPIVPDTRHELFEIPRGTWARRMAGEKVEILPPTITLTLGLNDVLLLRNADEVPQTFGPALIMPGQSFRLPFAAASTYGFACSAHASGQLAVVVEPHPAPGWETLRWRLRKLASAAGR